MNIEKKTYSNLPTLKKVELLTEWITEKKGLNLVAIDLQGKQSLSEALMVVTATSIRHAQGISDFVLEQCRAASLEFLRMEGYAVGEWILVDLNDIIIHIFQEDNRNQYNIEDLWTNTPLLADKRNEA